MKALIQLFAAFLLTIILVSCEPPSNIDQKRGFSEKSQQTSAVQYSLPYLGKDNVYIFSVSTNGTLTDTLFLLSTGNRWKMDSLQSEIIWADNIVNIEKQPATGVKSDSTRVWMHPVRAWSFKILEFNPFPEVRFSTKSWDWKLWIGNGYLPMELKTGKGCEMTCTYTNYFTELKKIKTESESHSLMGNGRLITMFNPDSGFTFMNFQTVKGEEIQFQLTDICEVDQAKQKYSDNTLGIKLPGSDR